MVSHLPSPVSSSTRSSAQSVSHGQPALTLCTLMSAVFILPLAGAILGAITTGVGKAILEVYSQVSARSFGDLLELLTGIVLSLINVLAVAVAATTDGALIGLYSGGASALMALLLAGLQKRLPVALRPVAMVALACAGGAGAGYGAATTGSAVESGALIAFVLGGMFFGMMAAQAVMPRQHRSVRHSAKGQRDSDLVQLVQLRAITSGETHLSGHTRRRATVSFYIFMGVLLGASLLLATYILLSQRLDRYTSSPNASPFAIAPTGLPIAPANASNLVELVKVEADGITHAIFSADGATLAVATGQGVLLYDSGTLTVRQNIASGPSRRIALTPDGTLLATIASRDVQLWQVADGKLVSTLSGHANVVEDLAFSPDGRLLATASLDRTARIWRISTGDLLYTLQHVGKVYSVGFSADSDRLVTGSDMGTTLWQSSTGIRLAILDIVFATVHGVSFDPAAQRVAAVTSAGILRVWESDSHLRLHNLTIQAALTALAFSPDGQLLALGGDDQQVRLLHVADGTVAGTLNGHQGIITSLAFHPAGHLLASTASDGTLRLWGMESSKIQALSSPTAAQPPTVAATATVAATPTLTPTLMPATTQITTQITSSASASLTVTAPITPTTAYTAPIIVGNAMAVSQQFALEIGNITDMAYSPDGQRLIIATQEQVRLLDGNTLRQTGTIETRAARVAVSPDSQILATAEGETVTLWGLPDGQPLHQLEIHTGTVTDVAFSPDGKSLATAALDHRVRLWRVEDGALLFQFSHFGAVYSVAFSPDSTQVVAGTTVGMTIWRVSDGARLRILALTNHVANRMVYSPDGTDLAAAMSNGELWLWRLDTGGRATAIQGHAGSVRALTFSPSGEMLASAGNDGAIHLWSAEDGADLRVLLGHTQPIISLAFHPAGTLLLSSSLDGTLRLWAPPARHRVSIQLGTQPQPGD